MKLQDAFGVGAAKLLDVGPELGEALAALQAAAVASPAHEPKQDSKKQRSIPRQLKDMLPNIACTLYRSAVLISLFCIVMPDSPQGREGEGGGGGGMPQPWYQHGQAQKASSG